MTTKLFSIAVLITGLLLPTLSQARPQHRMRMLDKLQLDATTRGQVQSIVAAARAEARALRAQLKTQRRQLKSLMQGDAAESVVLARADELHRLKGKLRRIRLKSMLQIKALLTPAQRQQLKQLRQSRFKALRAACKADAETLCAGVKGRRKGRCLMGSFDRLSTSCRSALTQKMGRRHRKHL